MRFRLCGALSAAAAAGLANTAGAAPTFYMSLDARVYSGDIAGGPITQVQTSLGGQPFTQRITSLGFNSLGQLHAATFDPTAVQGTLYDLGAESGGLTRPIDLGDNTPTFDIFDAGAGERMYALRTTQLLVSNDNTPDSFSVVGTTGTRQYTGSGWDGSSFLAFSGSSLQRQFYAINPFTAVAVSTGPTVDFGSSSVNGDTVHLGGGDWYDSAFYMSLFSDTDQTIVIGAVNVSTGQFSDRVVIPYSGPNPLGMGLVIIPEPATIMLVLLGAIAVRRCGRAGTRV